MKHIKRFSINESEDFSEDLSSIKIPTISDDKVKIILNYIIDNSSSEVDLKWKLKRFISSGDVSFLGNSISKLKTLLKGSDTTTDTKSDEQVVEGKAFKATKKPFEKKAWDEDKKEAFRKKVEDHIKSQGCTTKKVGDDFEVNCNKEHIAQVIFRNEFVAVKKEGTKFKDEFEYTEFGKIKSKLSEIIKSCKSCK